MILSNVKVKNLIYETPESGKIRINLDEIGRLVEFSNGCRFTPKGILEFCRSFKANKESISKPIYKSNSERNLHEVFESSVPDSYDYSILAHILLAQGRIKSKIVSVPNPKVDAGHKHRAFVIFANNGTTYVLDSAADEIVELKGGKPYVRNGIEYTEVDEGSNCALVSVQGVPDYDPQK